MVAVAWLIGATFGLSLLAHQAPDVAVLRDKLDAYLLVYQDKLFTSS